VQTGFAQKVVGTPKAVEFFGIDPVSFTPGFSQVNCAKFRSGNRLKRFPLLLTRPITRLKPGVNKNLEQTYTSLQNICPRQTKMLAMPQ